MKKTKTAEANIYLSESKSLNIEFNRFGEIGKPKTKEYFWLSSTGAFTIEDLRQIVKTAEELLVIVD